MSRLSRAQASLIQVKEQIAVIEAKYPDIVASKKEESTVDGASQQVAQTNQDFDGIHKAYMELLNKEENLYQLIDQIQGNESNTSVPHFNRNVI